MTQPEARPGRPGLKDLVSAFPDISVRREVGGNVNIHQKRPGNIERMLNVHTILETDNQQVPFVAISVTDFHGWGWKEPDATYILKPIGAGELEIDVAEGSDPRVSFQEALEAARRGFDILETFFRTDFDERNRYTRSVIDELDASVVERLTTADSTTGVQTSSILLVDDYNPYRETTYMGTVLRRNSVM